MLPKLVLTCQVQNLEEETGQDPLIEGIEIVTTDIRKGSVKAEAIIVGEYQTNWLLVKTSLTS